MTKIEDLGSYGIGFIISVFLLLVLLWLLNNKQKPSLKDFKYGYIRNPFDDEQIFTIKSQTQKEADVLALKKLEESIHSGKGIFIQGGQLWRKK